MWGLPQGAAGRGVDAGEHEPLRLEQLQLTAVLAVLAPVLQPVADPLHVHPAGGRAGRIRVGAGRLKNFSLLMMTHQR